MWMISMKAVLDIVSQYCPDDDGSCSKAGVDLREMLDEIEGLDETEVQPVKHGRWIEHPDDIFPLESTIECSVCGEQENVNIHNDNFCPNCGCKMGGDNNE